MSDFVETITEQVHRINLACDDSMGFDGWSFIRCPVLQALVRSWLNGAAGDGLTWLEIWEHLRECRACRGEQEYTTT